MAFDANMMAGTGFLAAIMGFMIAFLVIGIILYVYAALAVMAIAKKTNTENGWLAFIPIANIYLMTQMAGKEWWYMLLVLLLPLIPIIGGIASMAIAVYLWWLIFERIAKPGWWSILLLIPIVNLIIIGIAAWGK